MKSDDSAPYSPEIRLTELAALLAKGYLRWRKRRVPEAAAHPLEVPSETVLSVHTGLRSRESRTRSKR